MNMWKKSAGVAALLLVTMVTPAFAETFDAQLIMAPVSTSFVEVTATHALPAQITVAGQALKLDQQAFRQGETLYVPLRFIVEAAGGKVEWDSATQTVAVDMPDRNATFVIGQSEAEMNKRGVFYIRRNMIKMAGPVQLMNGRTMITADALTTILGLVERSDQDQNLDLITPPVAEETLPANGKVIPGEAQGVAVAVEPANVSPTLQDWALSVASAEAASFKVEDTTDGVMIGIAGGLQPTGGYTIEILGGGARLVDGTWYIDAKVNPPTEMATMALTNPVAFFWLPDVSGDVKVNFWTNGATP